MKISAFHWVAICTSLLITVTVFVMMDLSFSWVFYTTVLGQVLVVGMVYAVLRDNYTTTKTFDDFYEDRPDLGRRNY